MSTPELRDVPVRGPVEPERVFADLRARLIAFAISRLGDFDKAQDVAQNTLAFVIEKHPDLTSASDLVPLCIRVAGFKIKEARRGQRASVNPDDCSLEDPRTRPDVRLEEEEDLLRRQDLIGKLRLSMLKLGEPCRRLFTLRLQQKKTPEIAQEFGTTPATINMWEFRCRKKARPFFAIAGKGEPQ